MTGWSSNITAGTGRRDAGAAEVAALDDAQLVVRCRGGDMSSFGSLVAKYQQRVFNAILRLCGNRDDAEELCQEAFVKAIENLASFRQDSGFYTWLFRIATNLAISHRRRGGRVKFCSLEQTDGDCEKAPMRDALADCRQDDPQEVVARADAGRRVLLELDGLEDEFRVVVVLRDVEGMDYEQISQVVGAPVGTVKSRIYRARRLLQEKLHDLIA